LLLVSAPPVVVVLVVSGAHYKFIDPLLAQRMATLLAVAVACVAIGGAAGAPQALARRFGWSAASSLLLAALSWALQLGLLARFGYSLQERADLRALWSGREYAVSSFTGEEVLFWRCVAGSLAGGTPVAPAAELLPFFHRQSIVFRRVEGRAPGRARLRVFLAGTQRASSPTGASCPGPRVRDLVLEADCDLLPLLAPCGWSPAAPVGTGDQLAPVVPPPAQR
jgi:hypothetical protein